MLFVVAADDDRFPFFSGVVLPVAEPAFSSSTTVTAVPSLQFFIFTHTCALGKQIHAQANTSGWLMSGARV